MQKFTSNPQSLHFSFWDLICAAQLLLVTLVMAIKFWAWDFDDGFIVYRYVENIVSGRGWVYNPGEHYNASTSALNTILVTLISFFGVTPPTAAHILGSLSLLLLGFSIYAIFLKESPRWFSVAVASLCIFMMANNFTWGLESHLYYGLLTLYVALEVYGVTSWLLIGVLILIRPDALIVLALRVLLDLIEGKSPWRGLFMVSLTLAPWVLFSLYSFGNVFPATLGQKMWQGRSGFWGTGWVFLKGLYGYIRGSAVGHLVGVYWAPIVLSAPLMLVPQGVLYCWFRRRRVLLLFLFITTTLAAYSLLNVPNYHWYMVGLMLIAYVFAAFGILFITERLSWRFPRPLDRFLIIVLVLASGCAISRAKTDFFDLRTDVYRQLSEKIVAQTPADAQIAAVEVGVVGYLSKRRMIDLVGLTTPYGEFITGEHNQRLLEELRPEVIVLHTPLMPHEQAVFSDPLFVENYRQRDLVAVPGYTELSFFIRERRLPPEQIYPATKINQNDMSEISPGVYGMRPEDPWFEYQLDSAIEIATPVLRIEYQLRSPQLAEGRNVMGRVYISAGGAAYSEERAYPMMLRAGSAQIALINLAEPGTAQNKSHTIQRLRIDPIQDMALAADTSIEVKSVVVGSLR